MSTVLQRQCSTVDALDVINGLIHDIQNNLQVIRMEAELSALEKISIGRSECACDATRNIERLLGEIREWFLQPR